MNVIAGPAAALVPRTARRRWGYLLWGIAGAVIGVPEITAAADNGALPFTTISGMTGHLERQHSWVELVVVALIVLAVFSIVRVSPRRQSAPAPGTSVGNPPLDRAAVGARRTAGGRLTFSAEPASQPPDNFDDAPAQALFGLAVAASLAVIALATWAATRWWADPPGSPHYHSAYVLYGLLGLLWVAIPSTLAVIREIDMPFPTLFRTIENLEQWLASRTWPHRLGAMASLLVTYVIWAGLAILLLHLTLYPFPDITRILNPNG
jgi:hypothetical protein